MISDEGWKEDGDHGSGGGKKKKAHWTTREKVERDQKMLKEAAEKGTAEVLKVKEMIEARKEKVRLKRKAYKKKVKERKQQDQGKGNAQHQQAQGKQQQNESNAKKKKGKTNGIETSVESSEVLSSLQNFESSEEEFQDSMQSLNTETLPKDNKQDKRNAKTKNKAKGGKKNGQLAEKEVHNRKESGMVVDTSPTDIGDDQNPLYDEEFPELTKQNKKQTGKKKSKNRSGTEQNGNAISSSNERKGNNSGDNKTTKQDDGKEEDKFNSAQAISSFLLATTVSDLIEDEPDNDNGLEGQINEHSYYKANGDQSSMKNSEIGIGKRNLYNTKQDDGDNVSESRKVYGLFGGEDETMFEETRTLKWSHASDNSDFISGSGFSQSNIHPMFTPTSNTPDIQLPGEVEYTDGYIQHKEFLQENSSEEYFDATHPFTVSTLDSGIGTLKAGTCPEENESSDSYHTTETGDIYPDQAEMRVDERTCHFQDGVDDDDDDMTVTPSCESFTPSLTAYPRSESVDEQTITPSSSESTDTENITSDVISSSNMIDSKNGQYTLFTSTYRDPIRFFNSTAEELQESSEPNTNYHNVINDDGEDQDKLYNQDTERKYDMGHGDKWSMSSEKRDMDEDWPPLTSTRHDAGQFSVIHYKTERKTEMVVNQFAKAPMEKKSVVDKQLLVGKDPSTKSAHIDTKDMAGSEKADDVASITEESSPSTISTEVDSELVQEQTDDSDIILGDGLSDPKNRNIEESCAQVQLVGEEAQPNENVPQISKEALDKGSKNAFNKNIHPDVYMPIIGNSFGSCKVANQGSGNEEAHTHKSNDGKEISPIRSFKPCISNIDVETGNIREDDVMFVSSSPKKNMASDAEKQLPKEDPQSRHSYRDDLPTIDVETGNVKKENDVSFVSCLPPMRLEASREIGAEKQLPKDQPSPRYSHRDGPTMIDVETGNAKTENDISFVSCLPKRDEASGEIGAEQQLPKEDQQLPRYSYGDGPNKIDVETGNVKTESDVSFVSCLPKREVVSGEKDAEKQLPKDDQQSPNHSHGDDLTQSDESNLEANEVFEHPLSDMMMAEEELLLLGHDAIPDNNQGNNLDKILSDSPMLALKALSTENSPPKSDENNLGQNEHPEEVEALLFFSYTDQVQPDEDDIPYIDEVSLADQYLEEGYWPPIRDYKTPEVKTIPITLPEIVTPLATTDQDEKQPDAEPTDDPQEPKVKTEEEEPRDVIPVPPKHGRWCRFKNKFKREKSYTLPQQEEQLNPECVKEEKSNGSFVPMSDTTSKPDEPATEAKQPTPEKVSKKKEKKTKKKKKAPSNKKRKPSVTPLSPADDEKKDDSVSPDVDADKEKKDEDNLLESSPPVEKESPAEAPVEQEKIQDGIIPSELPDTSSNEPEEKAKTPSEEQPAQSKGHGLWCNFKRKLTHKGSDHGKKSDTPKESKDVDPDGKDPDQLKTPPGDIEVVEDLCSDDTHDPVIPKLLKKERSAALSQPPNSEIDAIPVMLAPLVVEENISISPSPDPSRDFEITNEPCSDDEEEEVEVVVCTVPRTTTLEIALESCPNVEEEKIPLKEDDTPQGGSEVQDETSLTPNVCPDVEEEKIPVADDQMPSADAELQDIKPVTQEEEPCPNVEDKIVVKDEPCPQPSADIVDQSEKPLMLVPCQDSEEKVPVDVEETPSPEAETAEVTKEEPVALVSTSPVEPQEVKEPEEKLETPTEPEVVAPLKAHGRWCNFKKKFKKPAKKDKLEPVVVAPCPSEQKEEVSDLQQITEPEPVEEVVPDTQSLEMVKEESEAGPIESNPCIDEEKEAKITAESEPALESTNAEACPPVEEEVKITAESEPGLECLASMPPEDKEVDKVTEVEESQKDEEVATVPVTSLEPLPGLEGKERTPLTPEPCLDVSDKVVVENEPDEKEETEDAKASPDVTDNDRAPLVTKDLTEELPEADVADKEVSKTSAEEPEADVKTESNDEPAAPLKTHGRWCNFKRKFKKSAKDKQKEQPTIAPAKSVETEEREPLVKPDEVNTACSDPALHEISPKDETDKPKLDENDAIIRLLPAFDSNSEKNESACMAEIPIIEESNAPHEIDINETEELITKDKPPSEKEDAASESSYEEEMTMYPITGEDEPLHDEKEDAASESSDEEEMIMYPITGQEVTEVEEPCKDKGVSTVSLTSLEPLPELEGKERATVTPEPCLDVKDNVMADNDADEKEATEDAEASPDVTDNDRTPLVTKDLTDKLPEVDVADEEVSKTSPEEPEAGVKIELNEEPVTPLKKHGRWCNFKRKFKKPAKDKQKEQPTIAPTKSVETEREPLVKSDGVNTACSDPALHEIIPKDEIDKPELDENTTIKLLPAYDLKSERKEESACVAQISIVEENNDPPETDIKETDELITKEPPSEKVDAASQSSYEEEMTMYPITGEDETPHDEKKDAASDSSDEEEMYMFPITGDEEPIVDKKKDAASESSDDEMFMFPITGDEEPIVDEKKDAVSSSSESLNKKMVMITLPSLEPSGVSEEDVSAWTSEEEEDEKDTTPLTKQSESSEKIATVIPVTSLEPSVEIDETKNLHASQELCLKDVISTPLEPSHSKEDEDPKASVEPCLIEGTEDNLPLLNQEKEAEQKPHKNKDPEEAVAKMPEQKYPTEDNERFLLPPWKKHGRWCKFKRRFKKPAKEAKKKPLPAVVPGPSQEEKATPDAANTCEPDPISPSPKINVTSSTQDTVEKPPVAIKEEHPETPGMKDKEDPVSEGEKPCVAETKDTISISSESSNEEMVLIPLSSPNDCPNAEEEKEEEKTGPSLKEEDKISISSESSEEEMVMIPLTSPDTCPNAGEVQESYPEMNEDDVIVISSESSEDEMVMIPTTSPDISTDVKEDLDEKTEIMPIINQNKEQDEEEESSTSESSSDADENEESSTSESSSDEEEVAVIPPTSLEIFSVMDNKDEPLRVACPDEEATAAPCLEKDNDDAPVIKEEPEGAKASPTVVAKLEKSDPTTSEADPIVENPPQEEKAGACKKHGRWCNFKKKFRHSKRGSNKTRPVIVANSAPEDPKVESDVKDDGKVTEPSVKTENSDDIPYITPVLGTDTDNKSEGSAKSGSSGDDKVDAAVVPTLASKEETQLEPETSPCTDEEEKTLPKPVACIDITGNNEAASTEPCPNTFQKEEPLDNQEPKEEKNESPASLAVCPETENQVSPPILNEENEQCQLAPLGEVETLSTDQSPVADKPVDKDLCPVDKDETPTTLVTCPSEGEKDETPETPQDESKKPQNLRKEPEDELELNAIPKDQDSIEETPAKEKPAAPIKHGRWYNFKRRFKRSGKKKSQAPAVAPCSIESKEQGQEKDKDTVSPSDNGPKKPSEEGEKKKKIDGYTPCCDEPGPIVVPAKKMDENDKNDDEDLSSLNLMIMPTVPEVEEDGDLPLQQDRPSADREGDKASEGTPAVVAEKDDDDIVKEESLGEQSSPNDATDDSASSGPKEPETPETEGEEKEPPKQHGQWCRSKNSLKRTTENTVNFIIYPRHITL